jgi:hypothetical protein
MLSIYNYINLDIYEYIYVCILPVRILLVRGHPVLGRGLLVRDRLVRSLLVRGLPVLVRGLLVRGRPDIYMLFVHVYIQGPPGEDRGLTHTHTHTHTGGGFLFSADTSGMTRIVTCA